jgi:hypothetical protein
MITRAIQAAALLAISGCGQPLHLGYDHGRAYTEALSAQADLTRPSIVNSQYNLYGIEGVTIRLMVQEASTAAEEASAE